MKKGQVSVFVIIGIVIIIILALIFFFRESITKAIREEPLDTQEYLTQQLVDIKREIGNCVSSETAEASKLLMENSGSFSRDFNYVSYFNKKYPILCREFEDREGCLAEPILISSLQNKLNQRLSGEIDGCINFEAFRGKDYKLTSGDVEIETTIFEDNILVNVNFPVELTKDVYSVIEDSFVYQLDIPLGSLTNVVNGLVQKKARGEEIDVLSYSLINKNKYRIEVSKPYPDELYDVSLVANEEYHYYFAIEGAGRFERSAILS